MRYEEFGTAGWADKIKVVSLEKMSARYKAGELDPRVH
jgi:fructose-bisphosphate aldolase class II